MPPAILSKALLPGILSLVRIYFHSLRIRVIFIAPDESAVCLSLTPAHAGYMRYIINRLRLPYSPVSLDFLHVLILQRRLYTHVEDEFDLRIPLMTKVTSILR